MSKIEYVAFADMLIAGDWRVEALTPDGVYITIFSGPGCEKRAVEYAAFKNGTLPKPKAVSTPQTLPPVPLRSDEFEIETANGHQLLIRPRDLAWSYDARRKKISAEPKPAIQRIGGIVEKGKE